MLHRKIEKEISTWIEEDKRALLVSGVRQAGKTYIIEHCLKEADVPYVRFNLIEQPEVVDILEGSSSTDDLILKLSLLSEKRFEPGNMVIFFDEIQLYREIVTRIKFLVEDGRFKYVLSGSLLGVEISGLKSAPVGYLKCITLYPLDFREFIQIFNVPDEVIDIIADSYRNKTPVDSYIHSKMMEYVNMYLIIGGMPQAVEEYRSSGSIDKVIDIHQAIAELYKLDFTQYEKENRKLIISNIYSLIPAELNSQNKRFRISDIDKNLRYERISDSFVWLVKAGVAIPVYNVTEPKTPLLLNSSHSLLKLFMSDVGMLTSIYGRGMKLKVLNNDPGVTKGAVYENFAAQELLAHGFDCYYFSNKKTGELDFVIQKGEDVIPVEIKSGKDYKRHSALNNTLEEEQYGIREAYCFSSGNVESAGKVTYYPIYMLSFIEEEKADSLNIPVERFMWA